MKYRFNNPITNSFESFDTMEEAEARLSIVKADYLKQEEYRFSVAKEVVEGNNTTWTAANLETDTEDYVYQVFNHNTGLHEAIPSLSQAKARNHELKDKFISEVFAGAVSGYEEPQSIPSMPSTIIQ